MKTPLKQVVKQVIKAVDVAVLDYSDSGDFRKLWAAAGATFSHDVAPGRERSSIGLTPRLVIVWSRTLSDPVLLPVIASDCITPLDWAAAYAKSLGDDTSLWPQVLVLDLRYVEREKVPAVAFYHGLNPSHLGWLRYERMTGLQRVVKWLNESAVETAPERKMEHKGARDRMLRDSRRNLTEGGKKAQFDHHAVSNVIGLMILRGGLPPTFHAGDGKRVESAHAPALKALLRAVELIDEVPLTAAAVEGATAPTQPVAIGESMKGLHLALLDDQAHHGWASWLAEASEPNTSLSWDTSPKLLIQSLQQQLAPASPAPALPAADLRFKFVPQLAHGAAIPNGSEPILLLDLRLFAGRPKEEREFYLNLLLPIIKTHFLDREDLAWPAFRSEDPFNKAVLALEGETLVQESLDHIELLTWLPRVIALADMSLPIVIFSSTGRRELVKAFAPYKNIITTFEKPRNFAGGESLRVSTSLGLQRALADAKRILLARFVIRRLMATNLTPLEEVRREFQACRAVYIYHDESSVSNKPAFRVNSVVVGFGSPPEADRFETHLSQHVRFCGAGCLPKRPPYGTPNNQYGAWLLNQWNTLIKPHCLGGQANPPLGSPRYLLATAARGVNPQLDDGEPTDLLKPNGLDNINSELLQLLWECLIVDVVGAIAGPATKIRVYGATRDRAVTLDAANADEARRKAQSLTDKLWKQYGIGRETTRVMGCFDQQGEEVLGDYSTGQWRDNYHPNDDPRFSPPFTLCWKSLSTESFHSLVAHCIQVRQSSSSIVLLTKAIATVRGITLHYGRNNTQDPSAKHSHYLIDALGSLMNTDVANGRIRFDDVTAFNQPKDWAVRGFRDDLLALLAAARHADANRWGEALRGLCKINSVNHGSIAIYLLVERCRNAASKFGGADFLDCVDQLNVR